MRFEANSGGRFSRFFSDPGKKEWEPFLGLGPFSVGSHQKKGKIIGATEQLSFWRKSGVGVPLSCSGGFLCFWSGYSTEENQRNPLSLWGWVPFTYQGGTGSIATSDPQPTVFWVRNLWLFGAHLSKKLDKGDAELGGKKEEEKTREPSKQKLRLVSFLLSRYPGGGFKKAT